MTRSVLAVAFGLSFLQWASPAFSAEEARILPKGISRVRFVGVQANEVTRKFNERGEVGPIGGANMTLGMNELAARDGRVGQLRDFLNAMSSGAGDELYTGNIYQDIAVQQRIFGAAFEYGISSRWNFGIRFRVIEQSIRTGLRSDATNNASNLLNRMRANGPVPPEAEAGLQQIANFNTAYWENAIFASQGYDVPSNLDRTDFGYTEAGVKYLIYQNDWYATSALTGVRIPTGRDESLTNPLDRGTGGNYWGTALQWLQEFNPTAWLTFSSSAKYDYYFRDTKIRAVPKNENDKLPSLLPQNGQVKSVKRKPGDLLATEVAASYKFPGNKFSVFGAYQYNVKARDKYTGPGDLHYAGLSRFTDYRSTNAEFGGEFSTIMMYRQQKFPVPMQVGMLYNMTLTGKNVPDTKFGRVDLKFYF